VPARHRRPHQRIRPGRIEAQVKTGGRVLEPHRLFPRWPSCSASASASISSCGSVKLCNFSSDVHDRVIRAGRTRSVARTGASATALDVSLTERGRLVAAPGVPGRHARYARHSGWGPFALLGGTFGPCRRPSPGRGWKPRQDRDITGVHRSPRIRAVVRWPR
jgi:hypothetical protein